MSEMKEGAVLDLAGQACVPLIANTHVLQRTERAVYMYVSGQVLKQRQALQFQLFQGSIRMVN